MEENKTYDVVETGATDVYYLDGFGKSKGDKMEVAGLAIGGLSLLVTFGKMAYDRFVGEPKKKKAMEAAIDKRVAEVIAEANNDLVERLSALWNHTEGDDVEE